MSWGSITYPAPLRARLRSRAARSGPLSVLRARPELLGLLGLTGFLNLYSLSSNGWANTYYAAAVRSMSRSWHHFLYAAMDKSGLMTVDKPPLSLWVQALSARAFGFHPLSILVPQALMGIVAVVLVYDLTRRRFGRVAGFVAGVTLATTPTVVAVSRHNNPDELLLLCCVAAVWFVVRAFEDGRTRWLLLSGISVGLGFETKMAVALMLVPAIAAAWMWVAPRGRLVALRQLLAGGAAMLAVGLAWPMLVTLTPASGRPWISGTSDNSVWSLIFGYNGLGRVAGQSGGPPGGGGGTAFGGATGPLRLLQSGLGDQAGWLLGFAVMAGLGLLVLTRARRRDPRTGWLLVLGGSFLTIAVVFSFAHGIFHPYYVSFLAPFLAALVGAGAGQILRRQRASRALAPAAIGAGVLTELAVLGELDGALAWAVPVLVVLAGGCAAMLAFSRFERRRTVLALTALAALLAAPATWAAETLGHPTSGTFPTGGPASASRGGGFQGPPGGFAAAGPGSLGAGLGGSAGRPPGALPPGAPPRGGFAGGGPAGALGGGPASTASGPAGPSGGPGETATNVVASYARAHGGGAVGVASQSTAAAAIVASDANIAGLGGFSGRESSVTVTWLAQEVRSGHLRWVLIDGTPGFTLPGDTRTGSQAALSVVPRVCRAINLGTGNGTSSKLYDCKGDGSKLLTSVRGM